MAIQLYKGYEIRTLKDGYRILKDGELVAQCIGIIGATRFVDRLVDAARPVNIGKPISLINTPTHQRWWLPDRNYWYEIQFVGQYAVHRVQHNETGRVCQEFKIKRSNPNYDRFSLYAQQLAEKKYPRPTLRDRDGKKKKEIVSYNVVNVKDMTKPLMENVYFLHLAQMFKGQQTVAHPGETFEIVIIEEKRDDDKPER